MNQRKELPIRWPKDFTFLIKGLTLYQECHAARILNDAEGRKASVLMPCSVSVYEDEQGVVKVVSMNSGLMGRMFGGVISEVMGGSVSREQGEILSFLDE